MEWPPLLYLPQGAALRIAPPGSGCVPIALGSYQPLLWCCSPPPGWVAPPPEAGRPSPFLCRTLAPSGVIQWPPPRLLLAAPLVHVAWVLPAGPLPFQAPALPEWPRMAPLAWRSGSLTLCLFPSLRLCCLTPLLLVAAVPLVGLKSSRLRRHQALGLGPHLGGSPSRPWSPAGGGPASVPLFLLASAPVPLESPYLRPYGWLVLQA